MWKIHLKINRLQLQLWWCNLLNMCNSASWAHHSWLVDFGEHDSGSPSTMCTSSIVHPSSKLPFFMSRHVCHLIVFRSIHSLPFCVCMLSTVSYLVPHAKLVTMGLSWLDDWAEKRKRNQMMYSWETLTKGNFYWIGCVGLAFSNVFLVTVFQLKLGAALEEKKKDHHKETLSVFFHTSTSC